MVRLIEQRNLIKQNLKVSILDNVLPEINEGITYNLVTQKLINPYGFILQACKHGVIRHLYIATYSINLKAMEIITNLMDSGLIENWTLILNHNMKFKMKGQDVFLLEEEKKRKNFKIIKKYSHAKVTLIDQDDRKIVISGSGNYSENQKIEQYTINNDAELFDFHKSWMLDVLL